MTRTDLAACLLSLMLLPLTLAHAELASGEGFIEVPGGKVWCRVYAGAGRDTGRGDVSFCDRYRTAPCASTRSSA